MAYIYVQTVSFGFRFISVIRSTCVNINVNKINVH